MNFRRKIYSQIFNTSVAVIEKYLTEFPEEKVCAFALYSDSDASSVAASFNTEEHLSKLQAGDPDDKEYYKWSPAEWSDESFGEEYFEGISNELFELSDNLVNDEKICAHRKFIFDICVSVLGKLRESYFPSAIYIFAATGFRDFSVEVDWAKKLNNVAQASEFETWLSSV